MKGSALVLGFAAVVAIAACGKKDEAKPTQTPPSPRPVPAASAVEPAESAAPAQATVSLIVAHEVEDFDAWKRAFDAHSGARKDASAIWHSISREVDDPNRVYVHLVGTELAKLQDFASSDELARVMAEAGIKGEPELWLTNDVASSLQQTKIEGETYSLFVIHEVEDFDRWKPGYDADEAARKDAAGVLGASVARAVDASNRVVLHFVVGDARRAVEALTSDEMKQSAAQAGVKGEPLLLITKDVETSSYQ